MAIKYIKRIAILDRLIQIKGTGSPSKLAQKLNISERTLYEYLNLMKDLGAPIEYCKMRGSYYYKEEGQFDFYFKKFGTYHAVS